MSNLPDFYDPQFDSCVSDGRRDSPMTHTQDQARAVETLAAEMKAKSLGEKLCDTFAGEPSEDTRPWSEITDSAKIIWERLAVAFAASLSHDETASAVIAAQAAEIERRGVQINSLDALCAELQHETSTLSTRLAESEAREGALRNPVEVTIFCPQCSAPHVDEGEWATSRHHKTHQCQSCGHEWQPFRFATVGIAHPAHDVDGMKAALEPFAWVGSWLFARDLPDDTPMVTVTGAGKDVQLTRGMFKAAHTALAALNLKGGS